MPRLDLGHHTVQFIPRKSVGSGGVPITTQCEITSELNEKSVSRVQPTTHLRALCPARPPQVPTIALQLTQGPPPGPQLPTLQLTQGPPRTSAANLTAAPGTSPRTSAANLTADPGTSPRTSAANHQPYNCPRDLSFQPYSCPRDLSCSPSPLQHHQPHQHQVPPLKASQRLGSRQGGCLSGALVAKFHVNNNERSCLRDEYQYVSYSRHS